MSDVELAQSVGRSRPWIADRKAEVLKRVQEELIDELADSLHDEAVRQLLDVVTALEEMEA
jgi:hypothetical protein